MTMSEKETADLIRPLLGEMTRDGLKLLRAGWRPVLRWELRENGRKTVCTTGEAVCNIDTDAKQGIVREVK